MAGTFLSFQGFPAARAVFRRTRGFGTDWSYVDIPVQFFKSDKFKLNLPAPGDGPDSFLTKNQGSSPKGTNVSFGSQNPQGPDDSVIASVGEPRTAVVEALPSELDHRGTLTMAEVDRDGRVFRVDVNLYVVRTETVQETFTVNRKTKANGQVVEEAETGSLSMLRVHLVDDRYFWSRGVLNNWSFNVPAKLKRDVAQNVAGLCKWSVRDDLKPYTRADVAKIVVRSLWGKPTLVRWPKSWETEYTPSGDVFTFDRPPYESAVSALHALCRDGGAEDPILRLDGEVEIREAGDGDIAPAKDVDGVVTGPNGKQDDVQGPSAHREGVAPWNRSGLDGFRLWKHGDGQSTSREPQYPDDVVVVVGKPIVASVALDDWDPVLVLSIDDARFLPDTAPQTEIANVLPLTDDTVRLLTSSGEGDKKTALGIDWLRNWVLADPEDQANPDADPRVLELFRRQAWRYYRMPKTVTKDNFPDVNAQMLPMLLRAEVDGSGKRWPITVERFGFVARHKEFSETDIQKQINEANVAEVLTRKAIIEEMTVGNRSKLEIQQLLSIRHYRGLTISAYTFLSAAQEAGGVKFAQFGQMGGHLNQQLVYARYLRDLREVASSSAETRYEQALVKINELLAVKNGGLPFNEMLQIAKKLEDVEHRLLGIRGQAQVGLEKVTKELPDGKVKQVLTPKTLPERIKEDAAFNGLVGELVKLDAAFRTAKEKFETQRVLKTYGAVSATEFGERVVYRNLPRMIDGRARVVDADLGIVEVSDLAGHLSHEDSAWRPFEGRPFVPRPVRVIFGTNTRPAVAPIVKINVDDVDQDQPGATGKPKTSALGPVIVRPELTEQGQAAQDDVRGRIRSIDKQLEEANDPEVARKLLEEQSKLLEKDNAVEQSDPVQKAKAKIMEDMRSFAEAAAKDTNGVLDPAVKDAEGGKNVVTPKVFDKLHPFETHFWQAYRVKSRDPKTGQVEVRLVGASMGDGLGDQDRWNATVVHKPELEALIPLNFTEPNEILRLTKQCRDTAIQNFTKRDLLLGGKHTFARPWPINCDGRVAAVEIRSVDHQGAPCGCETEVVEGSSAFAGVGQNPPKVTTGGPAGGGYGSSQ